jgi:penicillin-binding protein 2
VSAPRYAVAVVVEHGGGGAAKAAPIVRDILLAVQQREQLRQGPGTPMTERPVAVTGRAG